jgi:hypothetical protein
MLQSRPFLEWHIDLRLRSHKNIRFLYNSRVTRLLADFKNTRIIGVEIEKDQTTNEKLLSVSIR